MSGIMRGGFLSQRPGSNGFAVTGNLTATGNETITGTSTASRVTTPDLRITEGGGAARMGTATYVAGVVTVPTTAVTANSRIQVTVQTPGGTVGIPTISARVNGTSFTITSTSNIDTSTVAWLLVEPA